MFLVDDGKQLFAWIGQAASTDERKNAMSYAHVSIFYNGTKRSFELLALFNK